ncbi:MAG TPA: hypothetical protein PLB55_25340 [Prosthecobacter sp.]|jgi:predicted nucleic acid-binding protein|nr:hypothetical protein [Prosthecobacter sp.]
MLIICDTSTLSALAETSLLHLLPQMFARVIITDSVHQECQHPGAPDAMRQWIAQAPEWLEVVADPVPLLLETSSLGPGEASAITLAWTQRHQSVLILDERRGRAVAKALGLSIIGAMAIVADAARRGLVDFEDALQRLQAADFRLSTLVIEEARARSQQS